MRQFAHTLTIDAPPAVVLDAFFDRDALAAWWGVKRSICMARPLGVYVVEWDPTEFEDDLLGRLGGVLRGTVIDFEPGREFFVADVFWFPPEGDPIGPMTLEASCSQVGTETVLNVRQSGWENSPRWSRYYDLISTGLAQALGNLKRHIESEWKDWGR